MICDKPTYPDGDRTTLFDEGLEFQDFVADLFMEKLGISITNYASRQWQWNKGENRQGIEIKLDKRILETGNVSIEVAEKSKADMPRWTDSGIMRDDNTWLYVQGNTDIVFVFSKQILQYLYKNKYLQKVWEPKKTIRTFLMPIDRARKCALKVFDMQEHGKEDKT